MKRKIVRQGKQAFTVTLPVDWIRNNGLKVGDEIDLTTSEKSLILRADSKSPGGIIDLDLTDITNRMKYVYINAAYAKGVDELNIKAEPGYYPEVEHNIGFAVASQKKDVSTVRDFSGNTLGDLDEVFKRVFQMIVNFLNEAQNDIFGQNSGPYETLSKRDMEINKFCLFLERSIVKQVYPDPKLGKILFAYAFTLEVLSDDVFRMWRAAQGLKMPKELKKMSDIALKAFENGFNMYYHAEKSLIKQSVKLKFNARKEFPSLIKKYPKHFMFLLYCLKLIEGTSDIIHLALMKQMKPKYI